MLDVAAIHYARDLEGFEFVVLPDRNLVSRMATVARTAGSQQPDLPTKIAIALMAFSQCLNFTVEPSIAFHELAHAQGNGPSLTELDWFRVADQAQPQAWVDLALGRQANFAAVQPTQGQFQNLAFPLKRWKKNYLAILKIAQLELQDASPCDRAVDLIDWMTKDYFLAGPALMFAMVYFAPRSPKSGLLKQLRSVDRSRALAGVRNAAWDITHISDFVRRVYGAESERKRYIFASADQKLAAIASLVLLNESDPHELSELLQRKLSNWWTFNDATRIARAVASAVGVAADRSPSQGPTDVADPVATWTNQLETELREWCPR